MSYKEKTIIADVNGNLAKVGSSLPADSLAIVQAKAVLSTVNSTTTPLSGSATFTGSWEDVSDYDFIEIILYSDVNSATNGAVLQFSIDGGSTTAKTFQNTITATGNAYSYRIPCTSFTHFKVTYTNGASAQAVFQLRTMKQVGPGEIIAPLGATISAVDSGGLTRAVLAGQLPSGVVQNLAVDSSGRPKVTVNNFDVETPIKSLGTIKATQQSIATTATQIAASALSGRRSISIKLGSSATQKVYIGADNTVTTSTGYELNAGDSIDLEISDTSTVWGIASTSNQTVSVMEAGL